MHDLIWYSIGIILTAIHRLVVVPPWRLKEPTVRLGWYLAWPLVAILWPLSVLAWAMGPLLRGPIKRLYRRIEEDDHGK